MTVPVTKASLSLSKIFFGVTCFLANALSLALLIKLVSMSPKCSCTRDPSQPKGVLQCQAVQSLLADSHPGHQD